MSDAKRLRPKPERCPCTSGMTFDECCGPVLSGVRKAGTAEALMRSRFTAFAVGDSGYLLASWHPRTRPRTLDLDDTIEWYRLNIESVSGGTPFDTAGEVTFTAHHRHDGTRGRLHERSRFERHDGHWVYVDGVVSPG